MALFHKLLNRLWPGKIRGRLIVGTALLQLVLMTAFVLYLVRHQRQFLQKQNLQQTFSFVNDYAINSTPFVMANDFDELERLTLSHTNFPNLKYAMIISLEGVVLSHTNTNYIGTRIADSISEQLNLASNSKILVENEHLLDIAVPVMISKNMVGWARAGVGQDYIQQNMVNIIRRAGLYIVLALVLSILFAVLIADQLSKGLYKLISTADHIKEGNRKIRAPVFQTFELSQLGTAFNQMLDDISANESLLSLVIESMPVGVWIFNEKGEITSGNSAGKELWNGSKTVGSKGPAIRQAWRADTRQLVQPGEWASTRAITKGETTINEEIEIELINGKRKSLLNSAIPLRGKEGKIVGAIAINVDITDRKKITEQLALSESTLRSAFEDSAIGMALVLPGGDFQRVNKELCRMLGYAEQELLSSSFQQITHPADLKEDMDYLSRTLNKEIDSFQVEKRYIHKNGSVVWAHVGVSLVRDTDGRPLFFVSQIEDIGERKRQEAIILHEKNLSDTMINFMPGVFYLTDLNANLIRWNANLETVSGYSHSEIATMKTTDFVESKQVDLVLARRREAIERGRATVEVDIVTRQGQKLDYYITLIPIVYNNQQCILGMGVDFSEKKRAENELKESEEKFRKLVEETVVGVFILQDGKYVYVNPQFEKISGYSRDELFNEITFERLIHQDDLPVIVNTHASRDEAETQSDHFTFRGITKLGLVIPIEMIISPISYKGGPAIIGTIIDITEQVEEEKRINRAVTNAQEVERQQISMELHDNVKQMVAASLLNIDFMKMLLRDEKTIAPIVDNIRNYMKEAIEELRRISHRLAPSVDSAVSLQEKIRTLVNTMNLSNHLTVNYHFENPDENPGADIQLAMYRILQEQFINILKHSNASIVDVTVERNNGDIHLAIEDNGIGFDGVATKTGIGLENIKRRVQVHNGRFFIRTAPGKGCKLEVTIPVS